MFEIKDVRPDFVEVHGPVMRSGNTQEDVGKPSVDPKIVSMVCKSVCVFYMDAYASHVKYLIIIIRYPAL